MGLFGGSKKKALKKLAKRQEAAGRAFETASQFKPVGTTNAFGTTQYTYNPQGQLESAGYSLDPRLSALSQNAINAAGGTGLQFANTATQSGLGLANLGAQYIATSPQEAAAKYMAEQQALLRPGQDYARAQLNEGLFNTGRGGLSVDQGGGIGAANPEATAYYNALARQQAEMALNSDLYGRQRVAFGGDLTKQGLGLGVGAYDPMRANLSAAQGVEGLGQNLLGQGLEMGQLRTGAAQQGAQGNLQGTLAGAQSRFQASMSPSFGQSLLGGLANTGLNYATGGLSGASGFDITGQGGGAQLGNFAMQGLGQYFGPGQATTSQIYAPSNQGFYQSASQPTSYASPSQYPGLNWANI
jgi:hypothetical protein